MENFIVRYCTWQVFDNYVDSFWFKVLEEDLKSLRRRNDDVVKDVGPGWYFADFPFSVFIALK